MDAFFVSVELVRRPELRGLPVVVGGTGPRGVIAAASYEARRFGVHSAMPSSTARRMCPNAVFLPGDHEHYAAISARVNEIFHSVTPYVEPLSLDEAFLDVTGSRALFGDATAIAAKLRARIRDELSLPASAGVAAVKFVAKIASDLAKPDGLRAVPAEETVPFLAALPVWRLWGVGPRTQTRLELLGLRTVGDVAFASSASANAAANHTTSRARPDAA